MATNVIRLNKDGQIEVDGVVFDIREFINKIDKKVNLFIQDNKPEEYGLLDFWYAPTDDILSVSKFINNELVFIEVTLAGKTLSASISGGTGGVSQDAVNNLASSLSAQIESVRTEMRSTFKDTINLSSITAYHLISGDISVSNEVISNGVGIYTYTGNTTTPPSIPLLMPIAGQWGDQVTETYGYMIEIRSRSAAGNWSIINSLSGQNKYLDYNSSGVEVTDSTLISSITTTNGLSTINLGSSARVNTNGVTYVMTVWQTTHQRSELTNQGKPAYTHYNPWSGFTINVFTGTQLANHKINHYLNRKLDLLITKNCTLADTMWCVTGEVLGDGNRLLLGSITPAQPTLTSNMAVHQGQYMVQYTDGYITGSLGAWENGEGHAMISFGWASSYIDDSGKLIGNFEIGKWKGTGVVGTNIITPREKPARLMFKDLSAGENWYLKDNMREGFTGNYTLEINSMAAEYPNGTMRTSGKNIISFDNILGNTAAKEYLYFIVYDNTNGTGKSTYLKPSDNPNININNCIIPFVNGVDTRGQKMVTISKSETITGLTYTPGTNYVWYDKLGNKSSTPSRPRYSYSDLDAEFPGDAPDLLVEDLNMWYSTSSSADLYPNGKLLSVASGEIGYDNGNGTVVGYTIPVTATLSVVNNQLKVSGSQYATARIQLSGLTPGKEYYFSCTMIKGTTTNPYVEMYTDNDSATVTPVKSGKIGVDSLLYKFIPVGTTKYIRFVNTNAVETGYALFDNMRVWEANCVVGSPITNSRNYLNHIFHADANGNLIREEEIVKTKYLNNVRIENLESVSGLNKINGSVFYNKQGSFLPVIEGSITKGIGTYSYRGGTYSVIGNRVNFELYLYVVGHTGTGNIQIAGLPFPATSYANVCVSSIDALSYTAGAQLSGLINNVTAPTKINLNQNVQGVYSSHVPMDTAFNIFVSGSYPIS